MTPWTRRELELIISVALAMVPRRIRRAYADKLALTADPARQQIAKEAAEAVDRAFEVEQKPPKIGHQ